MTRRATCPFSITRTQSILTAFDASGAVADSEAEDLDVTGFVSGVWCCAKPDIGLPAGFEDIVFKAKDELGFVVDFELTDEETDRANTALLTAFRGFGA